MTFIQDFLRTLVYTPMSFTYSISVRLAVIAIALSSGAPVTSSMNSLSL